MRLIKYLSKNPRKKEEVFSLVIRPDFQKIVNQIRKRWNIGHWELQEFTEENKDRLVDLFENNRLQSDVENLINKFNVSKRWLDILTTYIVYDDFVPPGDLDPDGLELHIDIGKNLNDASEYYLRLDRTTTIRDIKSVWPRIQKELRGRKITKKRPWLNFFRDYEVYKLASDGYTIEEIDAVIQKKFNQNLDFGHIKKIESTFRRKVGISNKYRKNKLITTKEKLSNLY